MPHFDVKTSQQLQELLTQHGGVAVVDCHATWCGPCKMIAPKALSWSDSYNVLLIKVDVDEAEQLAADYGVKAMPTFYLVKDNWNNKVKEVVGANQAAIEALFQQAKTLKN